MTNVILTGAAGFVGSHVLRHLLVNTDWRISCPVTFRHKGVPRRIQVAMTDLPDYVKSSPDHWAADGIEVDVWDRVDIVYCDLAAPLDDLTCRYLRCGDVDLIFNVASQSHVDRSLAAPVPFVRNNVDIILNVLEMARRAPHLKAILQVSTDEVYGPAEVGYASREWDPICPSNPYAASKAAQEALCFSYWRSYGVPLILTNTMNICGETQDPEKFIPSTIRKLLRGERIQIHAAPPRSPDDDEPLIGSRFYLHARNQADALLFLARRALDDPTGFNRIDAGYYEGLRYADSGADRPPRFNVVGERELTNLDVATFLRTCLGEQRDLAWSGLAACADVWYELVDFHSSRPGHDLRYALDGSKLDALGWKPLVPLLDSLRKTVEWTLAHEEWLR